MVVWLSGHWLGVVLFAVGVFLVWRLARPVIHRLVMRTLTAQERAMPTGAPEEERLKRAATIEDLANSFVRVLLVLAIVFVVFGVFELWPVIAGMGIALAALTLAGQSVVLDYIMGTLILVEGQYYLGDTLRVGTIEGEVEQIGLRRTVLRDAAGIVHSVSNGTIRISSNLTRIFAVAIVDIQGVRNEDVETVIAIMDQVGREMADDTEWRDVIVDPPGYRSTLDFTDLGVTLRMSTKVRPSARASVPAELRRRMAVGLAAAGIHLARRTGAGPEVPGPGGDAPGAGPTRRR
jgi:moderate conductance mechanosensitive channel